MLQLGKRNKIKSWVPLCFIDIIQAIGIFSGCLDQTKWTLLI